MKAHIGFAHLKLFVVKKLQLINVVQLDHTQQEIKKRLELLVVLQSRFFGGL
jgi:hypothetical protein